MRYKCPSCGSKDNINVNATVSCRIITDANGEEIGFEPDAGTVDYEEEFAGADCGTPGCSQCGTIGEFEVPDEPEQREPMPVTDGQAKTALLDALEAILRETAACAAMGGDTYRHAEWAVKLAKGAQR